MALFGLRDAVSGVAAFWVLHGVGTIATLGLGPGKLVKTLSTKQAR